jgi:hypothetical protein
MKRFAKLGLMMLLPVIGFGVGYVTRSWQAQRQPTIDDTWLFDGSVPIKGAGGALSYNSAALFEADVPLPEIEAVDVKIKLIAPPSPESQRTRVIAYVAQVRVASLEQKKIPPRYLEKRVEQYKAGPVTTQPLEQVTYVVQFTFDLLDKDAFKLGDATGSEQFLQSGKSNRFQEVTTQPFEIDLVRRITIVRTHLRVLRCESCR